MIIPREYQNVALFAIIKAFKKISRALVVMATGLGKTYVAAFWSKDMIKKGKKGLFLCHNTHILDQAIVEFRKVLGNNVSLKTFYGGEKDWDSDKADIVFATFQTLKRGNPFFKNEFNFVIVDESHRGQAPTFKEVILYFEPDFLLGLTATPERMDDKDIGEIFGDPVVEITLEMAIANNWLPPIEYHLKTDGLSHWKLKKLTRDSLEKNKRVSVKQVNETVFIDCRDEEIAEDILRHSGDNKRTIIFCERKAHAENFSWFLPQDRTGVCHSGKSRKVNQQIINSFREGEFQFLLSVNMINEGIDIPDAEVVVFLRCTDSKTIFLQQLGRGLRKIIGKGKVIVLDYVANCERILMIKDIVRRINDINGEDPEITKDFIQVSGEGFDFIFNDEIIDVLELLKRIRAKYISDVPHLLAEYSDKNELPSNEVRAGTNMYLWWNCPDCGAEYQMRGNNRLRGSKCTMCNCLTRTHPELVKEYSEKNPIPVEKILKGSHKKVLWKCKECGHEWRESVHVRTYRTSSMLECPACIEKVLEKQTLLYQFPKLAAEYSDKNKKPVQEIMKDEHLSKPLWICSKCGTEYKEYLIERTTSVRKNGKPSTLNCPTCYEKYLVAQEKSRKTRETNKRKKEQGCYQTARNAALAVIKLGMLEWDWEMYQVFAKQDKKLPCFPINFYGNEKRGGHDFKKVMKEVLAENN